MAGKKKKKKILIIDDSTMCIMALIDTFKFDYQIFAAKNGNEGLCTAKKVFPDVILLDIEMPDIDGLEVIKELKNYERTKNIPVLFITGINDEEYIKKGIELGAAHYLTKPVDGTFIKECIETLLK